MPIQKRRALKRFDSIGASVSSEATCPRSTKICSVSVMPMLSPAVAEVFVGAFQFSMLFTTPVLLPGEKTSVSPTFSEPASMRPAMMRRSSKRYTACTGKRSGRSLSGFGGSKESSMSVIVGPEYHFGFRTSDFGSVPAGSRCATLMPLRALIGMNARASSPMSFRNAV